MTNNIVQASETPKNQPSAFDLICQHDSNGIKWWSARDLQKMLGYTKWQRFEDAIDRAKISLENQGIDTANHLTAAGKLPTAKNPVPLQDYKLSRYACYSIAMNGDPRKPEIAQAQAYFIVKTRQAEVSEQKPQLSRMQILEMAIEAERELVALKAQVEADEPATALGQALINSSDPKNIRIGDFAKILGDVGQNRYFDELRACEIIALTSPLPYQRYIDAGYFRVTQVPGKGAASNKWFPVALITPKGQAYLAKRHSKHIRRETIRDAIECQVSAMV